MPLRCSILLAAAVLVLAGCASARPPVGPSTDTGQSGQKQEDRAEALRQRRAVSRALRDFRESLEGATVARVMELVDQSLDDYPRFEDQITALFRQTLERRVFFRESSWEVKGDHAVLIVDAEMVLTARTRARTEQRRRDRLQFDFLKTAKGWKIAEISPRGFFAP